MCRNSNRLHCRTFFACLGMILLSAALELQAAALKWESRNGYRVAPLEVPKSGKSGFTLLSPSETGILFTNQLDYQKSQKNQNLLNGAGVAAGDFDGDGNCDLYFCNLNGANGLFRNMGGFKFSNVTDSAGVAWTSKSRAPQCSPTSMETASWTCSSLPSAGRTPIT